MVNLYSACNNTNMGFSMALQMNSLHCKWVGGDMTLISVTFYSHISQPVVFSQVEKWHFSLQSLYEDAN